MKILLICSGNTCRSPLAEVMLAERLRLHADLADVEVASAGISAWDGAPASEGSYLVALERGLDLSRHRARMLTTAMVAEADLVLSMTVSQCERIADLGGMGKVHPLGVWAAVPGAAHDIIDPYGGDVAAYRETADLLEHYLDRVIERLRQERRR